MIKSLWKDGCSTDPRSLLRARATFMKDAYANPADYDENICRATACEVLARRLVHNLPAGRLESVMSTRFRYRESDGDASAPVSALETAIDQHCTASPHVFIHYSPNSADVRRRSSLRPRRSTS